MPETSLRPRIAVVDDDAMFRDMAYQWLSFSFNDRVLAFGDGHSAWEYMKNSDSADIVVSDVNMPEMSGFDLVSRIKHQYPEKICILVSGNPENAIAARQLGADGFMAKPFSMRQLVSTLNDLYSGRRERAA
ncbi:MAG: response regulator [Desulfobacterales bacterium]